jgi:hypothetical protein
MGEAEMKSVEILAREFSRHLEIYLGVDLLRKVVDLNKTLPPEVCASHDVCDANQIMIHALHILGVSPATTGTGP